MVNTDTMTISLPTHKVQAIQKTAAWPLHHKPMLVKDLAQMIGMLVAVDFRLVVHENIKQNIM